MVTVITNGTVTSFSNTPQAGDDYFVFSQLTEDSTGLFILDVMGNDLGGKAKSLYSLDDGVENEGLTSSADLLTLDFVNADNKSSLGALIEITADGKVAYTMTDESRARFQSLGAGEVGYDTFTYAIRLANGTLSWATVTVQITGTNDAAVITGTSSGALIEAGGVDNAAPGTPSATGDLLATDVDNATDAFQSVTTAAATVNGYGSFTVSTAGVWIYTLNNGNATVQALNVGSTPLSDSFTVLSADGTAQLVSVTITGTNDAATVSSADVTLAETNAALTTNGVLTSADVDNAANSFTPVTTVGTRGTFTLDAAGAWTFTANSAFDSLNVGQNVNETFTVRSVDGTASSVKITINGTRDGPTDLVLTGISPGANNVPNSSIGQLSAVGISGSVSYSATLVEKTLAGVVQIDMSADISVSTSGLVTATGGSGGVEEGRIYELNVTATDSGGSLTEQFRVVTGSTNVDTINLSGTADDLVFLAGGNDTILAGGGNDSVFGQNGSDLIHGGDGNDVLYGMNGTDTFFFDTALNSTSNVDRIIDFNATNSSSNGDTVYLSTAQFTGIGSGAGTLAAADFQQVSSGGSGDVSGLSVGGLVNVVYDALTGALYFDTDGGSLANATKFAVLDLGGISGTFDSGDIKFGL